MLLLSKFSVNEDGSKSPSPTVGCQRSSDGKREESSPPQAPSTETAASHCPGEGDGASVGSGVGLALGSAVGVSLGSGVGRVLGPLETVGCGVGCGDGSCTSCTVTELFMVGGSHADASRYTDPTGSNAETLCLFAKPSKLLVKVPPVSLAARKSADSSAVTASSTAEGVA